VSALPFAWCEHLFARDRKQVPSYASRGPSPTPRITATQVRAIAARSPNPVGVEDALAILMALLDRWPQTFSKGAARCVSRLALEHKLTLADTQLALTALAGLPTPGAQAGVDALIDPGRAHRTPQGRRPA
jgi:hypothetical protein